MRDFCRQCFARWQADLVDAVIVSAIVTIQVGPSATMLLILGRVKLEANSGGPVFCPLKQYFPHAIVVVGLNCGQIDLRWGVEYQPQRIGTLKNRCGRRHRERKFDAHGLSPDCCTPATTTAFGLGGGRSASAVGAR